jgi:hypothetical protein
MCATDFAAMLTWARPAGWTAAAIAATWLRSFAQDDRLYTGLTVAALVCAIWSMVWVLELAAGRPAKSG